MKRTLQAMLVGIMSMTLMGGVAFAEKGDKGKHKGKGPPVHVVISPAERQVVRDYVITWRQEKFKGQKVRTLPPGLVKKVLRGGELPPGWQKKLVRGEVLPLVVFEQASPLPQVLVARLPSAPPGTTLLLVEDRIVRVDPVSRLIMDVLDLASLD